MTEYPAMPAPEWTPTGSDEQLHQILHGEYACTRDWSAWGYGTMTEADFTPMGETEIVADLLAWRDAAVGAWRTAFDALHARLLRDLPGDGSELAQPDDEFWAAQLDGIVEYAGELYRETETEATR